MLEEFIKSLFEILFFHIGKFISILLFPKILISKSMKEPKQSLKDFFKLTYKKHNTNYFYNSSVTLIGLIFSISITAIIILIIIQDG